MSEQRLLIFVQKPLHEESSTSFSYWNEEDTFTYTTVKKKIDHYSNKQHWPFLMFSHFNVMWLQQQSHNILEIIKFTLLLLLLLVVLIVMKLLQLFFLLKIHHIISRVQHTHFCPTNKLLLSLLRSNRFLDLIVLKSL